MAETCSSAQLQGLACQGLESTLTLVDPALAVAAAGRPWGGGQIKRTLGWWRCSRHVGGCKWSSSTWPALCMPCALPCEPPYTPCALLLCIPPPHLSIGKGRGGGVGVLDLCNCVRDGCSM